MTCTLPGSSTGSQAFNSLVDPSLRCALMQSPQAQAITTGQAAFSLAQTIGAGQIPTEAQITAGLAGIGTLVAGPAGGLIMGAVGAISSAAIDVTTFALGAIAQALGLDQTPPATYTYKGLQRIGIDQVAWGPADAANWLPFARYQDGDWVWGPGWGLWGPNPDHSIGGRPAYTPIEAQNNDLWQGAAITLLAEALYFQMTEPDRWRWDHGSWQAGVYQPSTDPVPDSYVCSSPCTWRAFFQWTTLPPFEAYMATLLAANMRNWANAWPFVPPQQLLTAAVRAWNTQHAGPAGPDGSVAGKSCGTMISGQRFTCYFPMASQVGSGWGPNLSGPLDPSGSPFVSYVMSGAGDSSGGNQNMAPLAVNQSNPYYTPEKVIFSPGVNYSTMQPIAAQTIPIQPGAGGLSLGAKVAIASAATVGAAAGGMALYGMLTDQGAGYLFGKTVDALIGAEEARGSMRVQTLLFPRPRFTPSKARTWARMHGYRAEKVDVTSNYVRIRQRDPGRMNTLRTIPLGDSGVKAVVGR